jgi:TetR/AcrR family transcriptional regulator, transcriptional repressor for nem operon
MVKKSIGAVPGCCPFLFAIVNTNRKTRTAQKLAKFAKQFFPMPKVKQFDEETVMDSITQLFWTKGFNGTSIDELVHVSGLSRSSLYDTFGNKHDLFLKALSHYQEQSSCQLEELIAAIKSPKQKIIRFFQFAIQDILADKKRKGCFMVNSSTELCNLDKKVAQLAQGNHQALAAQFTGWIKAAQDAGEIANKTKACDLANGLYAALCGLRVMGQSNPDQKMLESTVKASLQMLE